MNQPASSSKINSKYLCKYTNPSKSRYDSAWGFKLVVDRGENFYSIFTGAYRYRIGSVKKFGQDWHKLYRGSGFYCSEMIDRTAAFNTVEDLKKFFPSWNTEGFCIIRVKLAKDLITLEATNNLYTCRVYAGKEIKYLERYE